MAKVIFIVDEYEITMYRAESYDHDFYIDGRALKRVVEVPDELIAAVEEARDRLDRVENMLYMYCPMEIKRSFERVRK